IAALGALWRGEAVTTRGEHVRLDDAICTPAPTTPPRIVVGVGGSRRTLERAVRYADELNLYSDPALFDDAREAVERSGRSVDLSVFLGWEFDKWPADVEGELGRWAERGAGRALVNVGGDDMPDRIRRLAAASTGATQRP
ncbi:MAG: LLM class flavin-dependent oxidoreductase, partial [Chloroflexota bacterium]|nr:LLM class flavin-dependent oxidoreductase [Chloroflexota bacterium]